jgi:hypothetical protein
LTKVTTTVLLCLDYSLCIVGFSWISYFLILSPRAKNDITLLNILFIVFSEKIVDQYICPAVSAVVLHDLKNITSIVNSADQRFSQIFVNTSK